MRKKLGSMLLEEGLIDKAQLEDALRIQREMGGKLGSILIQLGYLDAETLGRVLKEQLNVETVDPREIENIEYSVINSVPRDIVEEYHVLPVESDDREIKIATIDPQNTQILSELSFFLDKAVIPLIIPEGLLYNALKKYYNIEVEPEEEVVEEFVTVPTAGTVRTTSETPAAEREERKSPNIEVVEEVAPPPSEPVYEEAEEVEEIQPPAGENEFIEEAPPPVEKSSEEIIPPVEQIEKEAPSREEISSVIEEWTPPGEEVVTEEDLIASQNMDELVYSLVKLFSRMSERAIIFKVQKDVAFGWVGKGEGVLPEMVDVLMVPLCTPSIFKTASDTGETFFGPPPMEDLIVEKFMRALGSSTNPPRNLLITPVRVTGKTVLIFYLDNGPGKGIEDLKIIPEVSRISGIATSVIQKIITQRKRKS